MEFSLGTAGPPLVAAFLAALVCVRGLQGVAPALGLLDQPGGRKVHRTATPVVGGLAMGLALVLAAPFLASALALATGLPAGAALRPWVPLAVAMAALLALGLADDRRHLGSGPKFAAQGLAASHLPRALDHFRHAGLDPLPAPTAHRAVERPRNRPGDFAPGSSHLRTTEMAWHERLGQLWNRVRGR